MNFSPDLTQLPHYWIIWSFTLNFINFLKVNFDLFAIDHIIRFLKLYNPFCTFRTFLCLFYINWFETVTDELFCPFLHHLWSRTLIYSSYSLQIKVNFAWLYVPQWNAKLLISFLAMPKSHTKMFRTKLDFEALFSCYRSRQTLSD